MIIILSQKIDTESAYTGDEVFRTYHYPGRYRNQIHTGDVFVYYQGNRYDKSLRILEIAKQLATLYNLTENP